MPTTEAELPTIWEVPDDLWNILQTLLDQHDPAPKRGRPRIAARPALNGMIYRMRTGCQWNQLPPHFGDDASVHRTQQRWESLGVFDTLWAQVQTCCQELDGVDWQWQAADGCLGKARGVPKKGQKTKASDPILQTEARRASRKACWSKAEAVP